jgi:hypothetical protein
MRYEVTTGLTPREALEQAAAYFGYGGVEAARRLADAAQPSVPGRWGPCGDHRAKPRQNSRYKKWRLADRVRFP